jgi:hypothetical protein
MTTFGGGRMGFAWMTMGMSGMSFGKTSIQRKEDGTQKEFESTILFFCFMCCAAASWHFFREYQREASGVQWFHVRVSGGSVVYQDYWTTNPPPTTVHPALPWYESLTNYPAR